MSKGRFIGLLGYDTLSSRGGGY